MKIKRKKTGLGAVSKKGNLYDQYNSMSSKKNIKNTLIKSLVEVLGATIGAGLSATAGSKIGIPSGIILIGLGNYLDEKSGLLKIAGSSAVAYGIAKAIEERANAVNGIGEIDKAKSRLTKFKDEVLVAFYLDKLLKSKDSTSSSISGINDDDQQFGAVDLSALDMFENFNQQQADSFSQINGNDFPIDFAYSVIDEDLDD